MKINEKQIEILYYLISKEIEQIYNYPLIICHELKDYIENLRYLEGIFFKNYCKKELEILGAEDEQKGTITNG